MISNVTEATLFLELLCVQGMVQQGPGTGSSQAECRAEISSLRLSSRSLTLALPTRIPLPGAGRRKGEKTGELSLRTTRQAGSRGSSRGRGTECVESIMIQCQEITVSISLNDIYRKPMFPFQGHKLQQTGVFSQPFPMYSMDATIFSAYAQLRPSDGIHVGAFPSIGMEGCLHLLQESGATAKGRHPSTAGKERGAFWFLNKD